MWRRKKEKRRRGTAAMGMWCGDTGAGRAVGGARVTATWMTDGEKSARARAAERPRPQVSRYSDQTGSGTDGTRTTRAAGRSASGRPGAPGQRTSTAWPRRRRWAARRLRVSATPSIVWSNDPVTMATRCWDGRDARSPAGTEKSSIADADDARHGRVPPDLFLGREERRHRATACGCGRRDGAMIGSGCARPHETEGSLHWTPPQLVKGVGKR
eukprot:scaffold8254_cov108-Isochrysis_galbana.AAC.2